MKNGKCMGLTLELSEILIPTLRHVQLILKTPLPFLSPKGREALILAPQRYKGWGCSC